MFGGGCGTCSGAFGPSGSLVLALSLTLFLDGSKLGLALSVNSVDALLTFALDGELSLALGL